MMNTKIIITLMLSILLMSNFSLAEEEKEETSYWETIKSKFEELKSDNLEKSEKARNWIEEDLKRIGDWEYKVVKMSSSSFEEIEEKLNRLGDDRWECFWVEKKGKETVFYFKKPRISYLQKLPKGDLLKIINSTKQE
jgi:hypothetical protein